MKAATYETAKTQTFRAISIHAAREGGDENPRKPIQKKEISIHAAREGGDLVKGMYSALSRKISIHAAREGGDGGNV